ncbi:hypothetical protein BS47DRAFT_1425758, partial [Hydnum rufescens UP504]
WNESKPRTWHLLALYIYALVQISCRISVKSEEGYHGEEFLSNKGPFSKQYTWTNEKQKHGIVRDSFGGHGEIIRPYVPLQKCQKQGGGRPLSSVSTPRPCTASVKGTIGILRGIVDEINPEHNYTCSRHSRVPCSAGSSHSLAISLCSTSIFFSSPIGRHLEPSSPRHLCSICLMEDRLLCDTWYHFVPKP